MRDAFLFWGCFLLVQTNFVQVCANNFRKSEICCNFVVAFSAWVARTAAYVNSSGILATKTSADTPHARASLTGTPCALSPQTELLCREVF